jgi:hypothetical protein
MEWKSLSQSVDSLFGMSHQNKQVGRWPVLLYGCTAFTKLLTTPSHQNSGPTFYVTRLSYVLLHALLRQPVVGNFPFGTHNKQVMSLLGIGITSINLLTKIIIKKKLNYWSTLFMMKKSMIFDWNISCLNDGIQYFRVKLK